jgi:tetratricopeptide (TPR) repeat protein
VIAVAAVLAVAVAASAFAIAASVRTSRELAACDAAGARVAALWTDARERVHQAFAATGVTYAESTFAGTTRVLDTFAPSLATRIAAACRPPVDDEPVAVTSARRRCLDDRARALADQLEGFAHVDRDTVRRAVDRAWAVAEPACDDPRTLLFGPFGTQPVPADLAARLAIGKQALAASRFDDGVAAATAVLADARARGDKPAELAALYLLGDLHGAMGQPDAAIAALQQALHLAEAQGRDLDAVKVLLLLAVQQGTVKYDGASGHRTVAEGFAKLERIGGANPVMSAHLHRIDALTYNYEYRCRDAETEIRKALGDFERAYGPDHPQIGVSLSELADLACTTTPETIAAARRSLAILEAAYGADHPDVGGALVNLADQLIDTGNPGEARTLLVRADAILTRAYGPSAASRIGVLVGLGSAERALGNHGAALDGFRGARALIEATAGPASAEASANDVRIGNVLLDATRFADARAEYERALAIAERVRGHDHVQLAEPLEGISRAELALGHRAAAIRAGERALELVTRSGGRDPKLLPRARWVLARALWDAEPGRARGLADEARTGDDELAREIDAWQAAHPTR